MEQSLQGFILKKGKKTKGKKQMLTITKDLFQKVSNMILKGVYSKSSGNHIVAPNFWFLYNRL